MLVRSVARRSTATLLTLFILFCGAFASAAPPDKGREFAAILNEPNTYLQAKELPGHLQSLHSGDFPEALAQFPFNSEGSREWILDALICRWMEVDPQGLWKAVTQSRTMEDHDFAALVISDVYKMEAKKDLDGALAHAQQTLSGVERTTALSAVLGEMAKADPAKALALALKMDRPHVGEYTSPIFYQWAGQDLPAATRALLQITDDHPYAMGNEGIVTRLVEKDPASVAAWIAQLPAGKIRDNAMEHLGTQWAKIDSRAAANWVKSLPADQGDGPREAYYGWSLQNPEEALTYAASLTGDSWRGPLFWWGIGQWAYTDAEAAGRWIDQRPPSDEKNAAYGRLIESWMDYEPLAAGAYLSKIPAGPGRDGAIKTFSDQMMKSNPELAYQPLVMIGDAKLRQEEMAAVLKTWMALEPAKAGDIVKKSVLPAEVKDALLKGPHPN